MRVLFSQPLTLGRDYRSPPHYRCVGDERRLSYEFGQRYPRLFSDYVLRSHLALALARQRSHYDAIITGRYGEFFAALQGLSPAPRKPHLLLDVEWPQRHTRTWRRWWSGCLHRLIARGSWRIQVFCEAEADNYAAHYGIARDKFVWLPYCTEVDDSAYPIAEDDYVFTGGWQQRDHATFLQAVSELQVPVKLAAPRSRLASTSLPANVECLDVLSRPAFLTAMARARLVVLSLEAGLMRYPGVITYVTALRMGKCVIVNDPYGARSYITHGETGWLVRESDPQALATAIGALWDNSRRRSELATNARDHAARHFTLACYAARVDALLRQLDPE
jgi:glycosyltransferase involved in cell wall biosynthesis